MSRVILATIIGMICSFGVQAQNKTDKKPELVWLTDVTKAQEVSNKT